VRSGLFILKKSKIMGINWLAMLFWARKAINKTLNAFIIGYVGERALALCMRKYLSIPKESSL
jgi:hypothetical protein